MSPQSSKSKPTSKFTFDTEFHAGGDLVSSTARARQRKSLTGEEIDQLRAHAHAEGSQAASVRATTALAGGVDGFALAVRTMLDRADSEADAMRADAVAIALAAARKIAGAALDAFPAADIEGALRDAMHLAIGEPRILLRAAPDMVEILKDRIAAIAADEAYDGRVMLAADAGITRNDCRIEWRGGGAERSLAVIEAMLDTVVEKRFPGSTPSVKG